MGWRECKQAQEGNNIFLTLIFLIDVTSHVFHPGLPANLKITLHFNLQFSVGNNEGEEVKCSIQTAWASKFFPALLSHSRYRNRQIFKLYLNYIAYSLSFAKGFKVFHIKNYLRRELLQAKLIGFCHIHSTPFVMCEALTQEISCAYNFASSMELSFSTHVLVLSHHVDRIQFRNRLYSQ